MNRTDLLDLFNYNAWANARILAGAERLSTEQLTAPAKPSWRAISPIAAIRRAI